MTGKMLTHAQPTDRGAHRRPRSRRLALAAGALSLAAVGSGWLPGATASTTVAPAATTDHIGLFAQDWNGASGSRTTAQWQAAATSHDVLVGSPGASYAAMIPQLHSWNPRLLVLAYDLGPYTVRGTALYNQLLSQHPDYFARDANGNLITVAAASGSPSFPANTLMDWGNPGWRTVHAQRVASVVQQGGWDGTYVDSILMAALTATPINPATHQPYTKQEWYTAGAADLNTVKAALNGRYLFCSGLVNGSAYQSFSHIIAQSNIDGMMTDSWLRLASSPASSFPSAGLLQSDLDMVASMQASGKAFYGWTKVWSSATPAQYAAWESYTLAAYLLVRGANAYYTFDEALKADRTQVDFASEQAALGTPLGPYTVSNGVYQRQFQHGTVTLNSSTDVATVAVH